MSRMCISSAPRNSLGTDQLNPNRSCAVYAIVSSLLLFGSGVNTLFLQSILGLASCNQSIPSNTLASYSGFFKAYTLMYLLAETEVSRSILKLYPCPLGTMMPPWTPAQYSPVREAPKAQRIFLSTQVFGAPESIISVSVRFLPSLP